MRFPVQPQQLIGDHHASRERRCARSQAFPDGNVVLDLESNQRQRLADILRDRERSLPNQVVLAGRDLVVIAAGSADRQPIGPLEPAS